MIILFFSIIIIADSLEPLEEFNQVFALHPIFSCTGWLSNPVDDFFVELDRLHSVVRR
jgi:hypothetical protein